MATDQTWKKACDCKNATAKVDMRTAGLVCDSCNTPWTLVPPRPS